MAERKLTEKALTQFIEKIPQFVWWKDLNSIFLGCNQNVAKYVGLSSASDIVGMTDYDIYRDKAEAESVRLIDQEIIETGKQQLNFEEVLTLPGVGKRWLSTSKVPLYDDDHNIIGTIGWFSDITEFKEIQIEIDEKNKSLVDYSLQLQNINRDLELANIELERFTYAASHDLKNPIRTMRSFAELLKKKEHDKLDEKSLQYIDIICQSSSRMMTLIDDILCYAQSGPQDLIAEEVDLHKIVSQKIIDIQSADESKLAEINIDLPKQNIRVYPRLIGLVFYNLINNGIKFNHSASPIINCGYEDQEDTWLFYVEDNGIGIEEKHREVIFEPFKRLPNYSIEGSGIGLSTCKRIVTLHNGDIWVENSPNGNTLFKFTIAKELN